MNDTTDWLGIVILMSLLVGVTCFFAVKDGIHGISKKEIEGSGHIFPWRLTGVYAQIAGGIYIAVAACLLIVFIKFLFVML